jgi:hypothetical protein
MGVKKRLKEFYDFNYIFNIIDVVLIRSVNPKVPHARKGLTLKFSKKSSG